MSVEKNHRQQSPADQEACVCERVRERKGKRSSAFMRAICIRCPGLWCVDGSVRSKKDQFYFSPLCLAGRIPRMVIIISVEIIRR